MLLLDLDVGLGLLLLQLRTPGNQEPPCIERGLAQGRASVHFPLEQVAIQVSSVFPVLFFVVDDREQELSR